MFTVGSCLAGSTCGSSALEYSSWKVNFFASDVPLSFKGCCCWGRFYCLLVRITSACFAFLKNDSFLSTLVFELVDLEGGLVDTTALLLTFGTGSCLLMVFEVRVGVLFGDEFSINLGLSLAPPNSFITFRQFVAASLTFLILSYLAYSTARSSYRFPSSPLSTIMV